MYSCVACLRNSAADHPSPSRLTTVPATNRDTSNNRTPMRFFSYPIPFLLIVHPTPFLLIVYPTPFLLIAYPTPFLLIAYPTPFLLIAYPTPFLLIAYPTPSLLIVYLTPFLLIVYHIPFLLIAYPTRFLLIAYPTPFLLIAYPTPRPLNSVSWVDRYKHQRNRGLLVQRPEHTAQNIKRLPKNKQNNKGTSLTGLRRSCPAKGGFSLPPTWAFETHTLPHGERHTR